VHGAYISPHSKTTCEDDEVDVAALNNELEGLGFDSEDGKEGQDEDFDVADTIGKAPAQV
jgi:hypothetical protein